MNVAATLVLTRRLNGNYEVFQHRKLLSRPKLRTTETSLRLASDMIRGHMTSLEKACFAPVVKSQSNIHSLLHSLACMSQTRVPLAATLRLKLAYQMRLQAGS